LTTKFGSIMQLKCFRSVVPTRPRTRQRNTNELTKRTEQTWTRENSLKRGSRKSR
jgi:hypothetical protein